MIASIGRAEPGAEAKSTRSTLAEASRDLQPRHYVDRLLDMFDETEKTMSAAISMSSPKSTASQVCLEVANQVLASPAVSLRDYEFVSLEKAAAL